MSSPGCLRRDQISAYLLGKSTDIEMDETARHLADCTQCQAAADDLESLEDGLIKAMRGSKQADRFLDEPEFEEAFLKAAAVGLASEVAGQANSGEGVKLQPKYEPPPERLGQYRLLEPIGKGGMGAVYRALHTRLERTVALKVLSPEQTRDVRAVARFEREVKAIGKFDHANIVRPVDAGTDGEIHYLVMDFVDGHDLGSVVRKLGPLAVADACELVRQAAVGLQYVHERNMVHRDIKPPNLILDKQGVVKLLDLGLSLLSEQPPEDGTLTSNGILMGTSDYIAPEQCEDSHNVDVRADLYSLGCTLYQLLCGRAPFAGPRYDSRMKKVMAHMRDPVPPIRDLRDDVPEPLADVLDRLLNKSPDDRYQTPAELVSALEPFAAASDLEALLQRVERSLEAEADTARSGVDTPIHVSSVSVDTHPSEQAAPVQPATQPTRRRWKPIAIGATLAAVLLLAVIITITNRNGTVVIETTDPNVRISVMQGGEEIAVADAQNGWTIRLQSGEYDISLKGSSDRFKMDRDSVTVTRGDEVRVRVTRRPTKVTDERALAIAPVNDTRARGHQQAPIKVGIIGLDTTHAIAFSRILNDPNATGDVAGCLVVAAYPTKGSSEIEISQSRLPKHIAEIQGLGVEIVDSIDELLKRVDAVLLLSIDGRRHLEQVRPVLKAGKPVFVDKPIAGSLRDAATILAEAKAAGVPIFSSSALRFGENTQAARNGSLGRIHHCETYGYAYIEPTHPDLFWYGIHGVEALFTVMGPGCQSVTHTSEGGTIKVVGNWQGGRTGVFREGKGYGGKAVGDKAEGPVGSLDGYEPLVIEIVKFFRSGKAPVSAEETLDVCAFMEAADESKRRGGAEVSLASVLQAAGIEGRTGVTNRQPALIEPGPQKASPAPRQSDPDRDAANWVLSVGGVVKVCRGDEDVEVRHPAHLPADRFRLCYIEIPAMTDDDLTRLLPLSGLEELKIQDASAITHDAFGKISRLSSLKVLGLRSAQHISDQAVEQLARLRNLENVLIGHPNLTDRALASLCRPGMHYLYFSNSKVTDAGMHHLSQCPALRQLHLNSTQISDSGLVPLTGLRSLWTLEIAETQITDQGMDHLAKLPSLEELNVSSTAVGDAGVARLVNCRNLRELSVSWTQISDEGLAQLASLPKLRVLHLRGTQVTDAGVARFQRACPSCAVFSGPVDQE
ncbi:MAG: protein kinase [Planctomycetes bacterium]|nr:protein kinase [Planctomycetota bacterium]